MKRLSKQMTLYLIVILVVFSGIIYVNQNYQLIRKKELNALLMSINSLDEIPMDYTSNSFTYLEIKAERSEEILTRAPSTLIKQGKQYVIHSFGQFGDQKSYTIYYKRAK